MVGATSDSPCTVRVTLSVRKKGKPLFGGAGSSIKPRDIAVFSRQIAVMMAAGVPMVQSFDIVAGGQTNVRMKNMLVDIKTNRPIDLLASAHWGCAFRLAEAAPRRQTDQP